MIRSLLATVLILGMASSAFALDKAYFEIKKVKVTEVKNEPLMLNLMEQIPGNAADCSAQPSLPLTISHTGDAAIEMISPLGTIQIWVDQIINIGKVVWNIVQAGKPVADIKFDTANALPRGVSCWTDLSGWSMPASKVYSVQYENGLGMTVVDFKYRLMYTAGGSADGVGKYITNATFLPATLNVAWGFKFDSTAQIPAVFNRGTKQDPLAVMQMNMHWRVDSPLIHDESTQSYVLSGDGALVHME